MKESADKHLDDLTRKVMGESTIDRPSLEFTQTVMSQINALSLSKATTYVPLISKRTWLFIILGVIFLFGYTIFGASEGSSTLMEALNLERFTGSGITNPLASMDFSRTLAYTVLLFTLMLCIQIPILKRYFDKRIALS